MAAGTIRPDGTTATGSWTGTAGQLHENIDDPVSSLDGNSIQRTGTGTAIFTLGSIADVDEVTELTLRVNGQVVNDILANPNLVITLKNGSTTLATILIAENQNGTFEDTASGLSLSQAELDGLTVECAAGNASGSSTAARRIQALEVDVVYTEAATEVGLGGTAAGEASATASLLTERYFAAASAGEATAEGILEQFRRGVEHLPPLINEIPNPHAKYNDYGYYAYPPGNANVSRVARLDTDGGDEGTCIAVTGNPVSGFLGCGVLGDGNTGTKERFPRMAVQKDRVVFIRGKFKIVSAGSGLPAADNYFKLLVNFYEAEGSPHGTTGQHVTSAEIGRWYSGSDYTAGGDWVEFVTFCVVPPGEPDDPLYVREIGFCDFTFQLSTNQASEFRITDLQSACGVVGFPDFRVGDDGLSPAVGFEETPTLVNEILNPSHETDTNYWYGFRNGGALETLSRDTAWSKKGDYAGLFSGTIPTNTGGRAFVATRATASSGGLDEEKTCFPATPGEWYSVRASVNVSAASSGGVSVGMVFWDESGTALAAVNSDPMTGTGQKDLTYRYQAPAGSAYYSVRINAHGLALLDSFGFRFDAVATRQSRIDYPYFDGDDDYAAWDGAAHASSTTWADAEHVAATTSPDPAIQIVERPNPADFKWGANDINDAGAWSDGGWDFELQAEQAAELGCLVVRHAIDIFRDEAVAATGDPTDIDLAYWDAQIAPLREKGIKLLADFSLVPSAWRDGDLNDEPTAANFQNVADYIKLFVDEFHDDLFAVEWWNEPNLSLRGWDVSGSSGYVASLQAVYETVKAAHPDMPVVMAGLADQMIPDSPPDNSISGYLNRFLNAGGAAFTDAINIHPYPAVPALHYPPFDVTLGEQQVGTINMERRLRTVCNNHEVDLPWWITEIGASTTYPVGSPYGYIVSASPFESYMSESNKDLTIRMHWDYWVRHPRCEVFLVHSLAPAAEDSSGIFYGAALYDVENNWAPKQPSRDGVRSKFSFASTLSAIVHGEATATATLVRELMLAGAAAGEAQATASLIREVMLAGEAHGVATATADMEVEATADRHRMLLLGVG